MTERDDGEPELLDLDAPEADDDAPGADSSDGRGARARDALFSPEALGLSGLLAAAVVLSLTLVTDTYGVGWFTWGPGQSGIQQAVDAHYAWLAAHRAVAGCLALGLGAGALLRLSAAPGAAARALAGGSTLLGAGLLLIAAWTLATAPQVEEFEDVRGATAGFAATRPGGAP